MLLIVKTGCAGTKVERRKSKFSAKGIVCPEKFGNFGKLGKCFQKLGKESFNSLVWCIIKIFNWVRHLPLELLNSVKRKTNLSPKPFNMHEKLSIRVRRIMCNCSLNKDGHRADYVAYFLFLLNKSPLSRIKRKKIKFKAKLYVECD